MFIEEYILLLTENPIFKIDTRDKKLLKSFSAQIQKNIPFTDRQHALAKKKLTEYKDQFYLHNYKSVIEDLDNIKYPYRIIDRSKIIFLVEQKQFDLISDSVMTMIAIRFPYSNKMIKHINFIKEIQKNKNKNYDAKTKTHFVEFTEKNVFLIVSHFKNINFEIQKELLLFYNTLCEFDTNIEKYKPGIYNYKLKNVSAHTLDYCMSLFGTPAKDNLLLYYDRKNILGLSFFDENELQDVEKNYQELSKAIAKSEEKFFFLSKKTYTLEQIVESIIELKRFPLLIVLNKDNATADLTRIVTAVQNFIDKKDIIVLFRFENNIEKNIEFNETVKNLNLNSPINNDTKIVFLSNDKIPKPLLLSKWKPATTLLLESFRYNKITSVYHNLSSLQIHYDDVAPFFTRKNFIKL